MSFRWNNRHWQNVCACVWIRGEHGSLSSAFISLCKSIGMQSLFPLPYLFRAQRWIFNVFSLWFLLELIAMDSVWNRDGFHLRVKSSLENKCFFFVFTCNITSNGSKVHCVFAERNFRCYSTLHNMWLVCDMQMSLVPPCSDQIWFVCVLIRFDGCIKYCDTDD